MAEQKDNNKKDIQEIRSTFPDEIKFFEDINAKLDSALAEASSKVDKADQEYLNMKQYMSDYRGEIDPHEMFQNSQILKQIDANGAFKVDVWRKLAKIKESPYFARIDFQEENETEAEIMYIGRFSFMYENDLLIVDWRSPIAGMFYDNELGPAGYQAPMGRIEGNLIRKRQFQIDDGRLNYVLESSLNIQDNLLQRVLSNTSDDKMKSIIATIQKEQNQIIRNEKAKSMMIQGVAGSGKTSIALHRISYLLYRFKDRLHASNVTILSPNKVFGDYISTVLPELGDEPIYEVSFADLAAMQLPKNIKFEKDRDPFATKDTAWAARVQYKSTIDFVQQMDAFIEAIATKILTSEDYTYKYYTVKADFIAERFHAYRKQPIKKRLQRAADDIYEYLTKHNTMNIKLATAKTIEKSLNKMLNIKNSLALYKELYTWLKRPEMFVFAKKQTLEWADVYPFLYIHAAFEGIPASSLIQHLVIDEMQDYTPVQYAVINLLFPCQKTILGDFGQRINPNHLHTKQDILSLYEDASYVELTKSYRSTYEILMFANGIQQASLLEPIERHGEVPQMISCKDEQDRMTKLEKELNVFLNGEHVTLGVILKTNREAEMLFQELSQDFNVNLLNSESTNFRKGISITSIHMSKGLEFDEVIMMDGNDENYHTEYDRSLLYIAVTRAMHKLSILYTGKPSIFLSQAS